MEIYPHSFLSACTSFDAGRRRSNLENRRSKCVALMHGSLECHGCVVFDIRVRYQKAKGNRRNRYHVRRRDVSINP